MRCVFMDHVDQLLKQQEVVRVSAYTCPDHDAIELLLLELPLKNCLCSFAKVMHAHLHTVPETSQFVLRGLETG
jgi:hypothetical protein